MTTSFLEFSNQYVKPLAGRTLVTGSHVFPGREDRRLLYANAVGVDIQVGPGVDIVADLEEPCSFLGQFSHIDCISVLEHSRRPWLLAQNIEDLLVEGGTLFVSAPFSWREHGYPDDYWRFTESGLRLLFPRIQWEEIMYAGRRLRRKAKRVLVDGFPCFPRQEVVGFGRKA